MKKIVVFLMILMLSTFFTTLSIGHNGEIKNLIPRNINYPEFIPIPGELPEDFQVPDKQSISYGNLPYYNIEIQSSDGEIIELIEQLDVEMLLGYLENLTSFGPRVTGTEECSVAADYIYSEFEDVGFDVRFHNWEYYGYSDRNVEATFPGVDVTSDEIYIICGHYDSVPGSPGADDDASGVATLMAIGEIFSNYSFNHTIRFVAFSGEEQGLLGSHVYAEEAALNEDNIVAVLNADMTGYAITEVHGNNVRVFEDDFSVWITDFMDDVAVQYNDYIRLNVVPSGYTWGSDHYSFWENGYCAIFAHEYEFNPYWHTPSDTIDNMNLTYFEKTSRLLLASLAELAQMGVDNSEPNPPSIVGPAIGKPEVSYNYTFTAVDIDDDRIYYYVDWGDGQFTDWAGPFDSGEGVTIDHLWIEKGEYSIRAKSKDTHNQESNWETFKVNIPREKVIVRTIYLENILKLFNRFINLNRLFTLINL
ncbi:hypothetical protein AYK20_01940 [Thermoplasmatales archaeon SG8-52-1]|nr:MAG: hypothetical protein AYK20_01940 [Thermoplasmatales archaeon SG8-52-1]